VAFGQLGGAFLEGPEQHVAALAVGRAAAAGLLGVHALVDQLHGLGDVLALLGQQDRPVGGGDGEPPAVLAERLAGRGRDRAHLVVWDLGEDAELVPAEPVGAPALAGHGLLERGGQPDQQRVAGGWPKVSL
jgi:hypothetical protein